MIKTLLSVLAVLSFSLPSFSQQFSLDSVRADGLPAAEIPLPSVAPSAPAEPKDWTIIYYSTTKDKLKRSFLAQLIQMKMAGSSEKVNVVLEGSFPMLMNDGSVSTPTVRMVIGAPATLQQLEQKLEAFITETGEIKEGFIPALAEEVISTEYNVDTGDWRRAAGFARWAKAAYPAKRYSFLIFGHGNGIVDAKKNAEKGTLSDYDTKNYVTVPEMRLMMAEIGKVDVFLMQSCLMQMAEVVWQVKDHADVVVGSSEFMWSNGYPQPVLVAELTKNPGMSSLAVGDLMARAYIGTLPQGKTGHVSVIPAAALPRFAAKLDAWAEAVMALNDRAALMKAISGTVRFDSFGLIETSTAASTAFSISGDLYDFARLMNEAVPQETAAQLKVAETGRALMEEIEKGLVHSYYHKGVSLTGYEFSTPRGIAIHVPPRKILTGSVDGMYEKILETNYWTLPFANETRWGAFLNWVYRGK